MFLPYGGCSSGTESFPTLSALWDYGVYLQLSPPAPSRALYGRGFWVWGLDELETGAPIHEEAKPSPSAPTPIARSGSRRWRFMSCPNLAAGNA